MPRADRQQDVQLVNMRDNGTHLIATFRRPLDTCDAQDWHITVSCALLLRNAFAVHRRTQLVSSGQLVIKNPPDKAQTRVS